MSDVVSLTERRWDADDDTRNHSVTDMLRVAIAKIERGEMAAHHAILVVGSYDAERNSNGAEWMQAGSFDFYRQLGMLERVKFSLYEGSEDAA